MVYLKSVETSLSIVSFIEFVARGHDVKCNIIESRDESYVIDTHVVLLKMMEYILLE